MNTHDTIMNKIARAIVCCMIYDDSNNITHSLLQQLNQHDILILLKIEGYYWDDEALMWFDPNIECID